MQEQIEESAFRWQREVETGERVIVGVNRFTTDEPEHVELHRLDPAIERAQRERTQALRAEPRRGRRRGRRRGGRAGRRHGREPAARAPRGARRPCDGRRALRRPPRALGHVRRHGSARTTFARELREVVSLRSRSARVARRAVTLCRARARSGSAGAARGVATPDFARDVAPIVRETCAGCHRDGGIAPFAFRTERDLASRAPLLVAALQASRMPPWPPCARSPRYVGQARRTLDARERDDAARAGRARSSSAPAARGTALRSARRRRRARSSRAGRVPPRARDARRAYRPSAANGATDDYRCFLLDPKLTSDAFVTSARIAPGVALARPPRDPLPHRRRRRRARRRRSTAHARTGGWTCFGGPASSAGNREPARVPRRRRLDRGLGAGLGRRPATGRAPASHCRPAAGS